MAGIPSLPPAPYSAPMLLPNGTLSVPWTVWFRQLFNRLGGSTGSPVIADGSITTVLLEDGGVTNAKLASNAVTTSKIADNAVTNAKLAQMAAHSFKGNNTAASANTLDLTATQLTAEMNVVVGDSGSGGIKGLVPAAAAGDAAAGKYLGADGGFTVPPGSGTTPVGTVIAFAGASAPTGYVSADGSSVARAGTYAALFAVIGTIYGSVDGTHFNLPNAQGIFLRGAGTQTVGGISYTGTLGAAQGDQIQGHNHIVNSASSIGALPGLWFGNDNGGNTALPLNGTTATAVNTTTDGSNGPPRAGPETRPVNLSILYCIKF